MSVKIKILIVEHDPNDIELVQYELKRGGIEFESEVVQVEDHYRRALKNFDPDLILCDYSLPHFSGPDAFKIRQEIAPLTPFIFVSGNIGEENAVEYIRNGLTDYALKDKLFTLIVKVKRALKESEERKQKKVVQEERVRNVSRLNEAQAIAQIGSWEIDLINHTHHWSDEMFTLFGTTRKDLSGSTASFLTFVHPDDLVEVNEKVEMAFKTFTNSSYDFRFIRKDGVVRHGFIQSHFDFDADQKPVRRNGIMQDVTEKRIAEEKIKKANRLYAFISQVNQSIVHMKDEASLFRNACRIARDLGKFKVAWIGRFNDSRDAINLLDQTGILEGELPLFLNAPCQKGGPQDYVARTGLAFIGNDVVSDPPAENWKAFATTHAIGSIMVLPITVYGQVIGTFNLYAGEANFFDMEEIALLVEVTGNISFAIEIFENAKKHKDTEALVLKNEKQFRNTLDNMLEGIQIHDFNWRYIYVNDALVGYSKYTREELLGHSLMELYPGIEQTKLFKSMERCLKERVSEHLETEFAFPDGSVAEFELSIQPIPEGVFILSVDRTEQKKASEKVLKVNRLYTFISAINKSIVHTSNEQELLDNACEIAADIGQFKMAWIDLDLEESETLQLAHHANGYNGNGHDTVVRPLHQSGLDHGTPALRNTLTEKVMTTGRYAVSNDVQNDPLMQPWKNELAEHGIKASISLPIRKKGKTVGIFGFHSVTVDFFDQEEITLLSELTRDISFALDVFDNAKKHAETEELVIENEHRFRSMIENGTDLIALRNVEGIMSYVSPSVAALLGYALTELIGMNVNDLIHPDDTPSLKEQTQSMLSFPGSSIQRQQRYRHSNGHWIWCEGTVTNMLHEPGIHALVCNYRDISEKKKTEQQQEFDKNNLRALLNNTHDMMWSVDKEFKLITSNHAFDEMVKLMSGHTVHVGSDILTAGFSEEQLKRFKAHYKRAFAGETFTEIEHTGLPIDIWSEISYYPIYKEKAVIGTACFSRDVTEQKKAENHLRLLESVITNSNDSVLITEAEVNDEAGPKIVYVNQAFTKMTGYLPEEVLGKTPRLLQGQTPDRHQLNKVKDAIIKRQPVEVEMINFRKNGEEFWNNFAIVPVTDKDGKVTHWVSIQRDVTFRRRRDEFTRKKLETLVEERTSELHAALNKEKELVEMKNKFVSIASHEFRTPLSTISFAAESIRNYFHQLTAEEVQRKLIKIEDQASHMTNLLEDILTLGKSEAGKIKVKRVSLDLKDFIESLIEEVSATVKDKRQINFEFSCESRKVNADDKLLRNVINNLLTNALKFSPADTPVSITVSDLNGDILIKVKDRGIGIEENELEAIFESFQRGSNSSTIQGTGLGLSILKKAVELMNGTIHVESTLNKGSTFSVQIPMK